MAEAQIPVDLKNPGQVFACLGLVEAADVLLGDARGAFDWTDPGDVQFRIAASGDECPLERVLRFLDEAKVVSVAPKGSTLSTEKWKVRTETSGSSAFPFPDAGKPDVLPARLTDGSGNVIVVDHWGDQTRARRDRVKFWAGAGGYPGAALTRDALDLICDHALGNADAPFDFATEQSSSFRFDWRRDYIPIDAGFSPNRHGNVVMRGYPIVEVLAAVGLTNARPWRRTRLDYTYGVIGLSEALYDPIFLRAALGTEVAPTAGMPFRFFRMRLGEPGQEGQARCILDVIEETPS